MKKIFRAVWFYALLGLAAGVFYREFTKFHEFAGKTILSNTHVHSFVLGTLFFLIVMILYKVFDLSKSKGLTAWFWLYNVSLIGLLGTIAARGILQVLEIEGTMLSHIAGTFHTMLAGAIIWFIFILKKAVFSTQK
ncbi:MAG: DUF2871 domain-containing protein [Eubacteriales bacterium]